MTMSTLFEQIDNLVENLIADERLYVDVYRSAWVNGCFTVTEVVDEWDGMIQFYDHVFHKGFADKIVSDYETLKNPGTRKIDYLTIYLA